MYSRNERLQNVHWNEDRKRKIKKALEQYGHIWATAYTIKLPETKPHFNKPFVSKIKKGPHPFYNNLQEFTKYTSLHGFKYLLNEKYTKIERFLWLVMIVSSIVSCGFVIKDIWNIRTQAPVIVSLSDTTVPVWEVPFPAVTICSETKFRQKIFDYTRAHKERYSDPPTINEKDLKTYHDLLLVCNNYHGEGPDFTDRSSVETLLKVAPTHEETIVNCLWGNVSCAQMFLSTFTVKGHCFSFNMLSADEIFRTENLHKDYAYVTGQNKSYWSLDKGYDPGEGFYTYPMRGMYYSGSTFEVNLSTDSRDAEILCEDFIQGFKVFLHSPGEMPSYAHRYIRLPLSGQTTAVISLVLKKTAKKLRRYTPIQRQCYFANERYLSFFRTYTKKNCFLECHANQTAQLCGCVPPYMPHGPKTKICGSGKSRCVIESFKKFRHVDPEVESLSKLYRPKCGCLEDCTVLNYKTHVFQAPLDVNTLKLDSISDIADERKIPSKLVLYFGSENYFVTKGSERYSVFKLIANCCGILGLFFGFSFLSVADVLFYFTLRLWYYMKKPLPYVN